MTIDIVKASIRASIEVKIQLLDDKRLMGQIVQLAERCVDALNVGGKIIFCENFNYDVASSEIRKKIRRGDDVSDALDAKVVQYINDNCLYQN